MDFSSAHIVKVGELTASWSELGDDEEGLKRKAQARKKIEPWLSALFQSEHLSVLLGSGSTIATSFACGARAQGMDTVQFGCAFEDEVNAQASVLAASARRGEPNIEDQLSAALALYEGIRIAGLPQAAEWKSAIELVLKDFLSAILACERGVADATDHKGLSLLASLLLSCAGRTNSRERLHIFTTNYDRFIEQAADWSGIRLLDRFVGSVSPRFRASRLQLDMHYNPPGVRGEPRLLEGVCHFTKLHGSVDWVYSHGALKRIPLSFGAGDAHPDVPKSPLGTVMIYPNAAKDQETSGMPFVDLFRDFSAAICRPNSTLLTYGYGFGDAHVNRIIADMLTLPSTHLCAISYGVKGAQPHARVGNFFNEIARPEQVSLLLGDHFGDLETLVRDYLPRPALDLIAFRRSELEQRRGRVSSQEVASEERSDDN